LFLNNERGKVEIIMRKRIKIIYLLIGLIIVMIGCSGQTTEEEYIDFINESLDKSEQALDKVYTVQAVAFEGKEYWQLRAPVDNLTQTIVDILDKLDKTTPPENFTKEHENLKLMFLAEQEYATKLKLYSETGDNKHFDNLDKVIDSLYKYHDNSIFTTEEYRKRGYERTTDFKDLMATVQNINRMKPDEYLIDIKDAIDNYLIHLENSPNIMQALSINSRLAKDSAETHLKGMNLLHELLSSMKPPKKYEEAHKSFIDSVRQTKIGAEYLNKLVRNPNSKDLLDKALDSYKAIKLDGVKSLNNAVKTDLK
jgi:hypothetical protein